MLFTMMISLAIASTVVEMMFAARFPIWRKNAHKFKWVNMTVSILLSFLLGVMFGAAGLITLGAAMISTVLSIPGYQFLHWAYDSPQALKHNGNMIVHLRAKWGQVFKDLAKMIYGFLRIITAPIWVTVKIIQKLKQLNNKIQSRRAHA
jgi:hypothetical protein